MKYRARLFYAIAAAVVLVVVLVVVYCLDPSKSSLYPPCPFYALTGLYCPGCGSGRGLHQLLHGHLFAAFNFNPLLILALPAVAYECWHEIKKPRVNYARRLLWVRSILVVVLVFWVLRNIPFYPFTLLAP